LFSSGLRSTRPWRWIEALIKDQHRRFEYPKTARSSLFAHPHALGKCERNKRMSDAALDNESNVSNTNAAASTRGAGYAVYDPVGQKIGSAEDVFVNRNEEPEYRRVRIGLFGRKSVLIPEGRRRR
jgi:hypothetical protein